MNFNFFCWNWM